ncbi:hypothetical protein N7E81_16245 [Reichenbachiella carrageenanivorans]|uniref:Uncharacterized protein n=1 Tax=Reichenbachiella carrageenanivorans TaxID=2979869 RepID=A0ABY6CYC2_9BACT|nr:hypothetical protein [Reichenbachiella carrageenanivorans]UXX78907.1 hypothetical protein N7E81_16245 [Reichenbachiella carrageenanivorans]
MYTASLSEIKKELKYLPEEKLLEICLRLAKYKKDNKELLHYMLLEAGNESFYIEQVKSDITEAFETVNASSMYLAKKTIRKVLRLATKQIRFSGIKQTEVEVLIFFCQSLIDLDLNLSDSKVMMNLLDNQVRKIEKALSTMHEDLQYDYQESLDKIRNAYK